MAEIRGPGEFIRLRRKPATVDGGFGRVPAAVQPADSKPEQPKRGPKDAERLMQAELLGACRELTVSVRQVADVAAGLQSPANGVLLSRLVDLGAAGRYSYAGDVGIGSVLIGNQHPTDPVYVQSGDNGAAQTVGVGVQVVPAGQQRAMPVGARAFTIWGPTTTPVVGAPEQVILADPAPGVSLFSATVPAGESWELIAARFGVSTSAVAGSRIPEIAYRSPAGVDYLVVSATSSLGPSTSTTFNFWQDGSGSAGSGNKGNGLPRGLRLLSGSQIRGSVFGMDVADDIAVPALTIQRTVDSPGALVSVQAFTGLQAYGAR